MVDVPDPTVLHRVRDGVYAADLLIAAVAELDLFTWLATNGPVPAADLRAGLGLAERPADVLLTYCAALGLVDRDLDADDRVELTELGRRHLVVGSPFDLRAYYGSLAERPAVHELVQVLRTDIQAAWASARGDHEPDWSGRLGDPTFAERITAAMDARVGLPPDQEPQQVLGQQVRAFLGAAVIGRSRAGTTPGARRGRQLWTRRSRIRW
jgi:methyltransferase family protein